MLGSGLLFFTLGGAGFCFLSLFLLILLIKFSLLYP